MRRSRAEIAADKLLADRIDNLQRLIADSGTAPADRERYHRQLNAALSKQRKRREHRERECELQKRERARKFQAKHHGVSPAPEPSPELPASVRNALERSRAPIEETPQPEPVPDAAEIEAAQRAAEHTRRLHELENRVWKSESGIFVVYKLPDGRLCNESGIEIDPFLRRAPAGAWYAFGGTPAMLIDAEESPAPAMRWWHGFNWTREKFDEIQQQLAAGWTLPPPMISPEDRKPVIASPPGERRRQQEHSRDSSRFDLGQPAGVGKNFSSGG